MAIDPETFSRLTNAVQQAVLLSQQRMTAARAEAANAEELDAAIRRAAEAVRDLRPNDGKEQA